MNSRRSQIACVGLRAKTARATAVVVSGTGESPQAVSRAEITLSTRDTPVLFQPYHQVMSLPWDQAILAVQNSERAIEAAATRNRKSFLMPIDPDILDRVNADFPTANVEAILNQLQSVSEDQRILRCIAFAARGHPWYFDILCRLAKVDYRDVIMAAEYERLGERLYDFTKPISEARIEVDRYPSPNVLRKRRQE